MVINNYNLLLSYRYKHLLYLKKIIAIKIQIKRYIQLTTEKP